MSIFGKIWEKIIRYEKTIFLVLGLILASIISFEAGFLNGRKSVQNPIIIEKSAIASEIAPGSSNFQETTKDTLKQEKPQEVENSAISQNKECIFVGSKNSNKYHIQSCQWAKRIKPENIVCFSSKEDAVSKGYVADKCVK